LLNRHLLIRLERGQRLRHRRGSERGPGDKAEYQQQWQRQQQPPAVFDDRVHTLIVA
jgi:hypothetical protein